MRDGAINPYGGVDRYWMGELYSSHTKSIGRQEPVPITSNSGKDIINTPRGKADVRAFEEKEATLSLTTKAIEQRIAEVKEWNNFRVDGNLTLHFKMREWVFLKVVEMGLMISVTYKTKEEALFWHRAGKIYWAGENF
jgi:hypothetical protein